MKQQISPVVIVIVIVLIVAILVGIWLTVYGNKKRGEDIPLPQAQIGPDGTPLPPEEGMAGGAAPAPGP